MKQLAPILVVALVLLSSCALGRRNDDDNDDDTMDNNHSSFVDKECTISKPTSSKYQLFMRSFIRGRSVSVDRFEKYKPKEARWIISPVDIDGRKYFEIKNKDMNTYIGPRNSNDKVTGNFDSYAKTGSLKNLWIMSPPYPGKSVSIKNVAKKTYLDIPRSGKSYSQLAGIKTTWTITCD